MQLVEMVAETDDEILVQFLDGEMPTSAQLKAGLRKATLDLKLFPVLCGSAFKNKGIQTLLDAVVDYLPSPLDIPPIIGLNPSDPTEQFVRHSDDSEPFSALGFKLINDQFGKLGFIRIYSGSVADRRHGAQSAYRQDRARWPSGEDARQQARRHHRDSWLAISAPAWASRN